MRTGPGPRTTLIRNLAGRVPCLECGEVRLKIGPVMDTDRKLELTCPECGGEREVALAMLPAYAALD